MINNKKKIYIALSSVAAFSVFILIYVINKNGPDPEISPLKPNIQGGIQGDFSKKIEFSQFDYEIPKNLPTLTFKLLSINKDIVVKIKNSLSIDSGIEEFTDVDEGVKYFLNTDDAFLVITPKVSKIKYGLHRLPTNLKNELSISEDQIKNIALAFLNDKLLNNNFVLPNEILYLKHSINSEGFEKTNNNSEAVVYQVNFTPASAQNYKIVTSRSENPTTFVQITKSGEIYYAETTLFDEISKSPSNYPVKGFGDIQDSSNDFKLINLSGDYLSVLEISISNIKKIIINDIEVVYFWDQKVDSFLQPIFILNADIEISGSTANKAIFYLPAFK